MDRAEYERLVRIDREHSWHPFTQMKVWVSEDPLIIASGEGNYLVDVHGVKYLDGVSSLWCNVHGHRKRELDESLVAQAGRIAHSTMLGLANIPATELASELIEIAPADLTRVFYSDSGAESVEIALRMAAQYWQLRGERARTRFVALEGSYHGDTTGAVSVGYSEPFHVHIRSLLFQAVKIRPPQVFRAQQGLTPGEALQQALSEARDVIAQHPNHIAALIIEPMMQGAAGMWDHPASYLRDVAHMVREAGGLVIADEVATGFGRTGAMFACEHAALAPDLMCVGKGLTGGYLPLAATFAREAIYDAFLGEPEEYRAFYYGHTYTGNPLAAAVARENLRLFDNERVIDRIQPRISQLRRGLSELVAPLLHVTDVRQVGLMVGIEIMRDPQQRTQYAASDHIGARVTQEARNRGVVIRNLGDVVILMPPLSIGEAELDFLLKVTQASIEQVTGG